MTRACCPAAALVRRGNGHGLAGLLKKPLVVRPALDGGAVGCRCRCRWLSGHRERGAESVPGCRRGPPGRAYLALRAHAVSMQLPDSTSLSGHGTDGTSASAEFFSSSVVACVNSVLLVVRARIQHIAQGRLRLARHVDGLEGVGRHCQHGRHRPSRPAAVRVDVGRSQVVGEVDSDRPVVPDDEPSTPGSAGWSGRAISSRACFGAAVDGRLGCDMSGWLEIKVNAVGFVRACSNL